MDQKPPLVLIVGTGRSGTTFLGKLLDSHPRVRYRHEPDWAYVDPSLPFLPRPTEQDAYRHQAAQYFRRLAEVRAVKVTGKTPLFRKSYRSGPREAAHRLNLAIGHVLDSLGIAKKRDLVWDMVQKDATDDLVTVIKSVNSLARAPLFAHALPNTPIVHIIRHPAGVVASRLRGANRGLMGSKTYIDSLFDAGYAEASGLKREQVQEWPLEKQFAFEWMTLNETVYRSLRNHEQYICVTHEALSRSTEKTTQSILAHIGIDWNEQTAHFIRSLRAKTASSGFFDVQRAPEPQIERWRNEMTNTQLKWIEEVIEPSRVGQWFLN